MRITDLDERWLADSLDVTSDQISDVRHKPLGTGQVADTYRVNFDVDSEPRSLVLKLTPESEVSAAAGVDDRSYVREVTFYQTLAPTLAINVPQCLRAEVDDEGREFALLLEDLAPCRPGDQLIGCTVDEAAAVLSEAAKLHAPRWGDASLASLAWLPPSPDRPPAVVQAMSAAFDAFGKRYRDMLDDEVLGLGRRFFDRLPEFFAALKDSPWTIQHGDFRPDNLVFEAGGGARPIVVVDWQTVQRGPGVNDVSYFLGGCLPTAERRTAEGDLLRHYHDELRARGVRDYSFDDCWKDYARYAFQGIFVGVLAAMVVKRTDRGDRMFTDMVDKAAHHALDLDALARLA